MNPDMFVVMKIALVFSLLGNIALFGVMYTRGNDIRRCEQHAEFIANMKKQNYNGVSSATSCQVTTAFVWCTRNDAYLPK